VNDVTVKNVSVQGEWIVVENDHEGIGTVFIPFAAIADRMAVYGLDTPPQAIDACLREHLFRVTEAKPEGPEPHHLLGGLHSSFAVRYGPGAKAALNDALARLRDTPKS